MALNDEFVSTNKDEVTKYQSVRYISTSEVVWRILAFSIHDTHPTIMHLDVHLENGQRIYFDPDNVAECLKNPRQTTLFAFFRICEVDQFARYLTYYEVPSYYSYHKQRGVFNRGRRGGAVEGFPGIFKDTALGRVYTVHPNNGECYFLRLLFHTVQAPTTFAFLRTFDGVEYPTYRAAYVARRLLDGNQNCDDTLAEASELMTYNFPFQYKRVQFPMSVCFAMSIKSQGQTLRAAGVDLRTSCFSHGQLYVACSRVTSPDSLYILAVESQTLMLYIEKSYNRLPASICFQSADATNRYLWNASGSWGEEFLHLENLFRDAFPTALAHRDDDQIAYIKAVTKI